MSCMQSTKLRAAASISKEIDRTLQQDKKRLHWELKVLLLGASESGKSTVMKQMKILHGEGYSEEERRHYKVAVYRGTIQAIKDVISSMERQGIRFEDVARAGDARQLLVLATSIEDGVMSEDLAGVIRRLWEDAGVQASLGHSPEHQPSDTTSYYLHNLDRICRADYIPTEQDVLRARVRTTGIQETRYQNKWGLDFKMTEFGDQRSNWKKWIHYFEMVDAIIFCVELTGYDTNQIHQQMQYIESLYDNKWLKGVTLLLFFNKKDLFAEKITKIPLTSYFPEYKGDHSYKDALDFFWNKLPELLTLDRQETPVHMYFTCSTDTENMKNVFECAEYSIAWEAMRRQYWSPNKKQ